MVSSSSFCLAPSLFPGFYKEIRVFGFVFETDKSSKDEKTISFLVISTWGILENYNFMEVQDDHTEVEEEFILSI